MITIVSPVYRAEKMIGDLCDRITKTVETITPDYEIILVDDGSPDQSWKEIERCALKDKKIKGIKLSRNFGQHQAITAGLSLAKGEWVVVMDCDLQDRPEEIIKLYEKTKEGYSIVLASRKDRNDGFFKQKLSEWFYKTLGYLTDTEQTPEVANFGIYHKNVIEAILSLKDYVRYFPTMVKWVGFKYVLVDVEHSRRLEGDSSYDLKKLIKLGINVIISFSDKPLRLTIRLGLLVTLMALLFIVYNGYLYFTNQVVVMGYTSIIFSIWFIFGVMITFIGMLGLYIGRIFDQVKSRPVFIVEKELNNDCLA